MGRKNTVEKSNRFKHVKERLLENIRIGMSVTESCEECGVSVTQFYTWRRSFESFEEEVQEAITEAKRRIVKKLEGALYKKALGYEVEDREETTKTYPNGGVESSVKNTKRHIQPDTGALIFALCNLAPDEWQKRQKMEIGGPDKGSINIEFGVKAIEGEIAKLGGENNEVDQGFPQKYNGLQSGAQSDSQQGGSSIE